MNRTWNVRLGGVAMLALLTAPHLYAQDAPEVLASLRDDFRRQKGNVVRMVAAMPEAGLRTAPTEGVRDFAQQIEHIVQGNMGIVGSGMDHPVRISGFDPEVYLNSKEELTRFVEAGFDAVDTMLAAMTPEDLHREASLFGQAMVPKWKLIQTAYEHGVWTLGATVPYVRLQGGTPPAYNLIPGSG
ncbi:MAG: DinB family protein [Gemmatimonadota bacterium]